MKKFPIKSRYLVRNNSSWKNPKTGFAEFRLDFKLGPLHLILILPGKLVLFPGKTRKHFGLPLVFEPWPTLSGSVNILMRFRFR